MDKIIILVIGILLGVVWQYHVENVMPKNIEEAYMKGKIVGYKIAVQDLADTIYDIKCNN